MKGYLYSKHVLPIDRVEMSSTVPRTMHGEPDYLAIISPNKKDLIHTITTAMNYVSD